VPETVVVTVIVCGAAVDVAGCVVAGAVVAGAVVAGAVVAGAVVAGAVEDAAGVPPLIRRPPMTLPFWFSLPLALFR
jgi:hypothetical protein